MPYDIFISYRRNGGEYTAKILRDRLQEAGYRVFFDVESLRSGDFNTKLYSVIDECTDFLLVLSPNALDRCVNDDDWVRREIEYALEKGKNVVPVMLRQFAFPETLPPSLEPLRYRNGLEANSQFFDAFLQQLQQKFLLTRLALWRRISCGSVLRRSVLVLLVAVLVVAAVFGIRALSKRGGSNQSDTQKTPGVGEEQSLYPAGNEQKNLVNEVLYYAMENLTRLNLMGEAMDDALQAAQRYLSSGGQDFGALQDRFALCRQTVTGVDPDDFAPTDGFLNRLAGSPFVQSDVTAMHDSVDNFRSGCLDYLAYIEQVAASDYYLPTEDKLEIVDCYRTIVEETLQANAYCCNEMLLPVTDRSALEEFWYEYLPGLTAVPLQAAGWQENAAALDSAVEQCVSRMEKALLDLTALSGNTNAENKERKELVIRYYVSHGYDTKQAEQLVVTHPELAGTLLQIRQACLPQAGDDADALWWKMMNLLECAFFDDALQCVDAYEKLTASSDRYAQEYIPALRRLIAYMRTHGIIYGAMVQGYHEPDGINEVFQLGDVIVAVNGTRCKSYEDYVELKAQGGDSYTVDVLRFDDTGEAELLPLALTRDMPRVQVTTVVYTGEG